MIYPPSEPSRDPEPLVPGMPADLRRWALEVTQIVLLAVLLYLVLTTFVGRPFAVEQRSMEPTLRSGDHIVVDSLTPHWDAFERGEVVVFDAPAPRDDDGAPYVKRVIGLPGDRVQLVNGRVYVTPPGGVPTRLAEPYLAEARSTLPQDAIGTRDWMVPDGAYFVLGDNRSDSVDSRTFGAIPRERIVGRALLRYLPLDRIATFSTDGTARAGAAE